MYSEHTQFPIAIKDKKLDHLDLSGNSKRGGNPEGPRAPEQRKGCVAKGRKGEKVWRF